MTRRYRIPVLLALLFTSTLVATVPALAQSRRPYNPSPNTVRLRFGSFDPDGDSVYWHQREIDFFSDPDNFDDDIFALDYLHMLSERWGIIGTLSYWEGGEVTSYRDFVDDLGGDIFHDTDLEVTTASAGLVYHFLRRDARIVPYVGAGLGIYAYDLQESGDFIDFDTFDIFSGTFRGEGETVGAFLLAGVEVPLTRSFGILGELRWHGAEADLEDDFREFGEIDLSGTEATLGVSVRF